MHDKKVIEYYNYTTPFYRIFWHRGGKSHALHYGLWNKKTRSLHDALTNTNRFLSKIAKVKKDSYVLDAGCGIGGSAIWLAKNKGARVAAININEKQLKIGGKIAEKNKLSERISFYRKDYTKTGFKKETFDVAWAIESVCHAKNKEKFIKEAHRILKRHGKLTVADGFLVRKPETVQEKKWLNNFNEGLALPNLANKEKFEYGLKKQGFVKVRFIDKTKEAFPSSLLLYRMCSLAYPISLVGRKIGLFNSILINNIRAGRYQYYLVKRGLVKYGIFYAEK